MTWIFYTGTVVIILVAIYVLIIAWPEDKEMGRRKWDNDKKKWNIDDEDLRA